MNFLNAYISEGRLYIFQPEMVDCVDPMCIAVKGQVVQILEIQNKNINTIIVGTPDGKKELGLVAAASLRPVHKKMKYDAATGLTEELNQLLA